MKRFLFAPALLIVAACSTSPDMSSSSDGFGGGGIDGSGISSSPLGGVDSAALGEPQNRQEYQDRLAVNAGDTVTFGYDQYDLSTEAQAIVRGQADFLKTYQNVNVTITGHTDMRGTREYNLALGDRRAAAVKRLLVSQGIPESRINVVSYGKERPVAVGVSEADHAQNRRAKTEID